MMTRKVETYKNTPEEVMEVIDLFYKNNLNYIMFKCEHIFEGQKKNSL